MPYNLTTLENGSRELGIELSQKQKNQFKIGRAHV